MSRVIALRKQRGHDSQYAIMVFLAPKCSWSSAWLFLSLEQ